MDSETVVSSVQRKIELQSPEDLAYLVANVRSAAVERLEEAFPQVGGSKGHDAADDLRNQIETLVNEYIDKTFTLAAPNLSINGLPVSAPNFLSTSTSRLSSSSNNATTSDPAYEPFDTRKRQRVADLVTQEEKLLEEVAALKRAVPARAAASHAAKLDEALARDAADVEGRIKDIAVAGAETSLDVDVLERQEGVEQEWRAAVEGLARLKRDMPSVVAKMERARVAGEYVATEGR